MTDPVTARRVSRPAADDPLVASLAHPSGGDGDAPDSGDTLAERWASISSHLAFLTPIEDISSVILAGSDGDAVTLLRQRSALLGPGTLGAEQIHFLLTWLRDRGAPHRFLRHAPTRSAGDKEKTVTPAAVQKTVTIDLDGTALLWTGVGDWRVVRRELRSVARSLGIRKYKNCSINPPGLDAESVLGVLPGMVTPFVEPARGVSITTVVARVTAHAGDVAVSLSPVESLLVDAGLLDGMVHDYVTSRLQRTIQWVAGEAEESDAASPESAPPGWPVPRARDLRL